MYLYVLEGQQSLRNWIFYKWFLPAPAAFAQLCLWKMSQHSLGQGWKMTLPHFCPTFSNTLEWSEKKFIYWNLNICDYSVNIPFTKLFIRPLDHGEEEKLAPRTDT
jgi:hypothetical protein